MICFQVHPGVRVDRFHQETLFHFRTSPTEGLSSSETIYETPLILRLCGGAVVSVAIGNIDGAVSTTIAVFIVLTVSFVQGRRSEKSLEALNKLVLHHCHLLRDGKQLHLLANELVPGDIVTFTTGDRVPADVDFEIDESSLTGETDARLKGVEPCAPGVALAGRLSVAHMRTLVENGKKLFPTL